MEGELPSIDEGSFAINWKSLMMQCFHPFLLQTRYMEWESLKKKGRA
jgi:hypothetical protein